MYKRAIHWFKYLSKAGKAGVVLATVTGLAVVSAATTETPPQQATPQTTPSTAAIAPKADVVTRKTVSTSEVVAYETKNIDDASLTKGTTKVKTEGVNGVRTYTYDVTYTNGVETSRVEVGNAITTQPVTKVVAVGTYVAPVQMDCPNGTYVNSAGNTVCSPYSSSSAPAGATAQCVDGTYSFSQSRRGTCSHHGGVATWL